MPPTLVPAHPKHQLASLGVVAFDDGVLLLNATQAVSGALAVIHSTDPLSIANTRNCNATLRIGWDGTLGYSRYGLTLDVPAPGEVVVQLKIHQPPNSPIKTTREETAEYARSLANRNSRFPDDTQAFAHWQLAWRQKLEALLMGGETPRRVAPNAEETACESHPGFDLLTFRYNALPDRVNTALLSLPKTHDNRRKHPLLLALHGHESKWGAADPAAFTLGHADDFCAYFAQRGWAVLHPATMDHTLQHERWTLQGEWTCDALRALDLALARTDIDASRVAVVGLSTGAHLAMNVLALEPRVRCGVVGCVLSTWHHEATRMRVPPHCDCGVYSQLAQHFEQCDWAALAAPRPVQFQHGRKDPCFFPGADDAGLDLNWNTGTLPQAEYDAMFAEAERAWRAAGRPDAVETHLHEGHHQVNNEAAFAWVTRWMA